MAIFKIDPSAVPQSLSMGGELRPRMKGTGEAAEPKLSPSGKPTFSTGVVVEREGGGQERGATIAVIETPAEPWPMGTKLKAAGDCWLTPYVAEGSGRPQVGLSFVVERLVPVEPVKVPFPSRGDSN